MAALEHIGFLGLGNMGGAMAERLLGEGIQLHVYDVSPTALARFTERGAIAHDSPKAVADAASIVFACLPNKNVSHDVASGKDGVIHGSAVRIYVEMSTLGKAVIEEIAAALQAKNIVTIDSPITGGPPGARAGTLAILVSGAPAQVQTIRPFLERIGKAIHVMGEQPGQAQIMKLVNNIVMAANMVVACEGLVMGAKAGLDADAMMGVLNAGSGGSTATTKILGSAAITGTFNFGAALSIIDKDMGMGLNEAELLSVPMPLIDHAREIWHQACVDGRGQDDFSSIIKVAEERAGVEVRSKTAKKA